MAVWILLETGNQIIHQALGRNFHPPPGSIAIGEIISLETFVTLCNALDVSPAYLLQGSLKNVDECLPDEVRERVAQLLLQLSLDIASLDFKGFSAWATYTCAYTLPTPHSFDLTFPRTRAYMVMQLQTHDTEVAP